MSKLCAFIIWLMLLAFGTYGWVMNIVSLSECDFEPPYKAEVIRAVGVPFAVLGGVVGYMDLEDGPKKE